MAANQLVQARIDGAIREEAAAVLAVMGLTVSDAVRLMLTKVTNDQKLPFGQLIPKDITIQVIKDGRAAKATKAVSVEALQHCLPTSMRAIDSTGQFKCDYKREKKIRHQATLDDDLSAIFTRVRGPADIGSA